MSLIPNFYKIDCEQEVVVQGKTTTFVTITRNDQSPDMPTTSELVVILYPEPNTFDTYARITAKYAGYDNDKLLFSYTSSEVGPTPSFNKLENGLVIKNWYDIVFPALPLPALFPLTNGVLPLTDAPFIIGDLTPTSFSIRSATGVTLKALTGTPTFTFDIGKYDVEDGENWLLNGGNVNAQMRTLNNTTNPIYWKPYVNKLNPFDGTKLNTPNGPAGNYPDYINHAYNEGTGLYSRVPALQTQIPYDANNTSTNGVTIKLDYDGEKNSHFKLNILLLSVDQFEVSTNLKSFIQTLIDENQIKAPYGLKSRIIDDLNNPSVSADYKEIHFFGYTEDYVKPHRDNEPIFYPIENPIYDDRASYGLIKTNPKLSGNVKLTVDSSGSLWLNSFNANDELSDSKYKKFPVSSNSTYQRDLYTFFDNGKTPTSIVFGLYEFDNQYLNTKRTYDEQYDNFYNYGIENLNSKFYDENFSFLAPLWLRKDVPDYFVLFRVNEPFNVKSYEGRDNHIKFEDYFSQARIIKTYDMRDRSKIGSYLRKLVNDDRYVERPLQVSWESDTATYWNGVAYQNGSLTAKGEFAYDYYHKDVTIKDFEEFITGGFERNGIISTNLINLEFLFDDEEAPLYGINRYFGLYVTENQLAEFEIEPSVLGKILGQNPLPKAGVDGEPYSTRSFVQTNPEGIQIPVHYYHDTAYENNDSIIPTYQGSVIGKFPLPFMVEDPLRFFYIKDRNDIFKRINKLTEVNYGTPGSTDYIRATQLQIFDNQEDLSSYAGVSEIVSQFPATLLDSGKAQLRVHLLDQHGTGVLEDNEEIILEVKRYNDGDINNRYVIQVTDTTNQSVTVEYFINEDTDYLTSSFTQPLVSEIVVADVNDTTMFSAGEQIYIVGGGYYNVEYVDTVASTIAILNLGNAKNSIPGTNVTANNIIANTLTGEATYTQNLIDKQLSIDNYLTLNLTDFQFNFNGYYIGDAWRIECDYPSVQKYLLNGTPRNIDVIYTPQYQQFTWRMIANPTGLQPGDAWDYPVLDPNGSEYLSQFSNKGTPAQVAKALATCINSFEGGVVHAYADGETLYMLSSLLYEDGNDIQFTRKLLSTSQFANVGFYVPGNVDHNTVVTQLTTAPYSSIDLKHVVVEEIDTPRLDNFYLKITRNKLNEYTIFGRDEADLSSYATATTTGIVFLINQTDSIFKEGGIPISLDMSDLLVGQTIEVAYSVSTGDVVKQNFIGGVQRKRNRAKISYENGQKYYSDHKVSRTGIVVENSNVILVDTSLLYLGAPISGPGIPEGSVITDVNADRITINKYATATSTNALLKMGDLNILNDSPIWQQWYQAQKGIYSRMKSWNVQGKLIYSLPYMDQPTYDDYENINGFIGINDNSIIQLEDADQEFYISNDERVVAYKVFRPTLGIFSIYPIKQFDFDFILSDYSYTPTLESLPYFLNEEILKGKYIDLPIYENFILTQVDKTTNVPDVTVYTLAISILNTNTGSWQVIENLTLTPNPNGEVIFNTFYPFYEYDVNEFPIYQRTVAPELNFSQFVGSGKRNFDKRYIRVFNESTQKTEIVYPDSFRITFNKSTNNSKLNVKNANYSEDRDLQLFSGFGGIQDIEGIQDLSVIQTLKEEGKYVEALTYQLLVSEYDRLRENFNKDYAVKSKVVPYINKWVQEGTDARENYYRLNNSMAFGINNLSPNDQVDFSETAVLTQEFPYLDTFPKNYPNANTEFSRSYMFAQLDDIAYQDRTWYDLITTDNRNDWFTKYFSVGYPTEVLYDGTIIPKAREERYTFFNYNNGLDRSQTLFRGIKMQGIIYDDTDPQNIIEISNSKLLDGYKFASIMRIVRGDESNKEKPVDIEFIRNDDFKSMIMVITVKVEDYRLQHGHTDYMSQYFMNDILKTTNQYQTKVNMNGASQKFYDVHPYTTWDISSYEDISTLRLRQGFLGGGLLQLGDKRLGGTLDAGDVTYSQPLLTMHFNSIDPTYIFNLQNELTTIINNYSKGPLDIYSSPTSPNLPYGQMYGKNGFVFGLHTVYKPAGGQGILGMYGITDNQKNSDKILPQYLQLNTAAETISYYTGIMFPNYLYAPAQSGMETGPPITVNSGIGANEEVVTIALEGGTFGYESIKNYLTVGNIKSLINTNSPAIEYYKVVNSVKTLATDYRIQIISPDTIIKTGILHFDADDDKPQEYTNVDLVGYDLVNTNMQEYLIRHRGYYEPKSRDIITFWLRESNDFTKHFGKDFILSNTHINAKSELSGIIPNYGINKVSTTGEILNIARGSAYKSLYPLIGEVAIDTWTRFTLDSSWDDNFYRNYQTITKSTEVEGIAEMKETKSFLASKAMNVPKSFEIHTFNAHEVDFTIEYPATGIGVNTLVTNTTVNDQYLPSADKPKLVITIDVKTRLLREIIENIKSGLYVDEFSKLQTYTNVNKLGSSLSNATISSLRDLYITKNILPLYEVAEIYLYVLYKEGIDLIDITVDEAEKNVNGYKIDKDCVVRKVTNFSYEITKILDPKVAAGYALSTNVKRI